MNLLDILLPSRRLNQEIKDLEEKLGLVKRDAKTLTTIYTILEIEHIKQEKIILRN